MHYHSRIHLRVAKLCPPDSMFASKESLINARDAHLSGADSELVVLGMQEASCGEALCLHHLLANLQERHSLDSSCGSEEPLVGGRGALLSRAYSASWSGLRVTWQSGGDFYAFAFLLT